MTARARSDLLVGIDGARFLRAAAREMDALGKQNARIAEVAAGQHEYAAPITDIYYLEKRTAAGLWIAETVEEIAQQGIVTVTRELQANLVPALTFDVAQRLVRGGIFNEWEPARRFVLDQVVFRCAGRLLDV